MDHCVQVADDAAEAVIEGRRTADPGVFLVVAHSQSDHVSIVHNVVVGECRTLWVAGSA